MRIRLPTSLLARVNTALGFGAVVIAALVAAALTVFVLRPVADRSAAGAVCQQGEDGLHTDFAVLFEPVERRLRLWSGPPALVEPAGYDIDRLLA